MKLIKMLLLLLSLGLAFVGQAQQQEVLLEGKVLNDTIDRSQLTVFNKSLNKGTITTERGTFLIGARVQDTIVISAVQYEPREIIVNSTMVDRKRISLYLIPKITELDNVAISNIDLSGNLAKDAIATGARETPKATDFGLPKNTAPKRTTEERRYYTAVTSGGGIPIDGLINAITGRLKMLKNHIKIARFEKKVQDNRYRFSDSIYIQSFNIPEPLVEDFVYYVFEDERAIEMTNRDDVYALFELMREKAPVYTALKNAEKN